MMKLSKIVLLMLLTGCSSTNNNEATEADINALDLTEQKSLTENYWVVTKNSFPKYPVSAAKNDISGCVEFSFVINKSGKAQNIEIIKSVPNKIFNKAATKSLKEFRWSATDNNKLQQPVLTTIQLEFSTSPKQMVAECISK